MLIIAHRGASGHAPEHTFAAWDLALEMGADFIEQDLQMTADGALVVLHDETLDRTARGPGCRGRVRDRSRAEIQDCNVGSWFNEAHPERARPEFERQKLPLLDDVLETYRGRARFYIETKNPRAAPGMEDELLRLLARHRLRPAAAGDDTVIIQSFSAASLRHIHRIDPNIPLVRLFSRVATGWSLRWRLRGVARYASGIGPSFHDADSRLVEAAHARGLVVHPWTVNDEATMRRLAGLGVDAAFSDFPDVLARVLRTRPAEGPASS